ncbi:MULTISPECIES: gamma carbonic anhydrase family protein [unclassified Paracoccus (in: a-proteobacteria)]|uniref:gamma carbonic anhydrase family protein n=1 Tax=unclassified Paracoccus (in: a-proteobacteria) TaxID=2688777 RepID=UPI0012B3ED76|nr:MULTISPECIES: gamma carbonic anhydrase family protein [unclassified Paracoccus (in: a-proteobacteria)]UXU74062.1 gamma carbonic anhydrase family protein [Paracoccus sp. SMMA_5]UXU79952.1 gamma carbonic anhydrase family protein [Paracoccus sp. SMMA_5_TC]
MNWQLDGIAPQIAPDAWVAPDAQLMGRVVIEAAASVWFGAVLRGDNEEIRLGAGSNIQDLCVCHTDPGCPLVIGRDCTIGHRAILHGCTIGDGALIGMGAIVLNRAVIGPGALIGAGALVAEGKEIPAGALVMGTPGRVVRILDDAAQAELRESARRYQANARRFHGGLKAAAEP